MFNSRTWHWLCVSAYIIFPGIIMVWFIPETSNLFMVSILMIAWAIIIGILGAFQAVLLVFGRLNYGCPTCKAPSPVIKGNRNVLIINCPTCGKLKLSMGSIFGLEIEKMNNGTEPATSQGPRGPRGL